MSTVALHQKYRPQTIAELVGQPYIKTALTNAVKHLQIAPAYLFTGSRGTGKTSTARIFAKSLNCLNTKKPTDQPCGICQSCRSIETSNSLDVSEIDAASNNGVDDARALIDRSTLAPVTGRYRIFILDECHCLTGNAFNALLKCIEEPPPHVVFILCTTELHKVLPTIVSRCQVFNFRTLSVQAIVQHLGIIADAESISIDEEALTAIATQAKKIKLVLSKDAVEYLAEAIGNDMTRAATELCKLCIYGNGKQLELAEVKELVPCQTQNSLQLASAIRQGESNQVLHLLDDLLSRSEPLMVIVATLLTQFRTWLWVKSAMSATGYAYVFGVKKDSELAQLCSISNPNRIYYLRQEVANTSINALAKAVTMMLNLEMSIKRGTDSGAVASHRASSKDLLLIILSVSRLFKLT
ncbi:DNA polymerase III subunit gamma/tau [Nostoc punctiforme FACHB-252]|uniref:DNA polymerase III subunit gamma/tau n=1 Tax=Nostoc punctiforme FACHB-252 TaxID=1357509 RepID=A0ABR8HA26_NOSPU|nr:DNA polymerase III subunit gamma/tau [Nostoc punctiforme]MBD2612588.1 DNA polymerase III subunit gamma/tau [Nostoc punctiforme FACHB-252]